MILHQQRHFCLFLPCRCPVCKDGLPSKLIESQCYGQQICCSCRDRNIRCALGSSGTVARVLQLIHQMVSCRTTGFPYIKTSLKFWTCRAILGTEFLIWSNGSLANGMEEILLSSDMSLIVTLRVGITESCVDEVALAEWCGKLEIGDFQKPLLVDVSGCAPHCKRMPFVQV